jgi:hypothetical protein
VGDGSHFVFHQKLLSETGCCHLEAARFVIAKFRGDVFARFHAVAAKRRSRTRNSQFGLLRHRSQQTGVSTTAPPRTP